jgi:predicted transcriptional regulator
MEFGKNLMDTFSMKQKEEPAQPAAEEQTATEEKVEETAEAKEGLIAGEAKEDVVENPVAEEKPEGKAEEKVEDSKKLELSDDMVTEYLAKKSGREIKSLDDLFKEPETAEDPIADLPDEIQQFVKYAKETGRSFEDWTKLNADYSKLSPLDAARQKAINDSGGELSKDEVDDYLEKKLNIDLSSDELEKFDVIELKNYSKDYINKLTQEQEKYKAPIEKAPEKEMVTLENGQKMPKEQYDQLVSARNNYLESLKATADKITEANFNVVVDNNGEKKELPLSYEYSKEDVHNMTSMASDLDATMAKLFKTENGFNHAALQEALFWMSPGKDKAINAIVHKALAQQAEEFLKDSTNANFQQPRIPSKGGDASKKQSVMEGTTDGSVKYDFSNV